VRLIALVESAEHVCCRYRIRAFRPHLEQGGHSLQLHPWPRHWWDWPALARLLSDADAAIIQRKLPARWQLHLVRGAARSLVFDFDDAVYGRNSYAPRGVACARRLRRFAALCAASDLVMAGNAFLKHQAERFTDPDRVRVLPTCVDPSRYPLARHDERGDETQLVWIGSFSTLRGLEKIRPTLDALGQNLPGLCLKLVCEQFFALKHLPVLAVPWTTAGEAHELAAADIGISWVPDDDWSRGKCGLKLLQYMAAGLPVIANPVGVHLEMVREGENGYLAETPEQWLAAVRRLAGDPELRRRMGAAGRRRVEMDYSVARGAALWSAVLDSLDQWRSELEPGLVPIRKGHGRRRAVARIAPCP
jgi:glycosyltransferase involved in cell wall biosynthesis